MPNVNLIYEQRLAVRLGEQKVRMAFWAFTGSAVVLVMAYGYLLFSKEMARSEMTRLNADSQKLHPLVAQIEANKKLEEATKPKEDTLANAQKTSDRWNRILAHLARQTPTDTWLTSFRSTIPEEGKPIVLTLNGMARSQQPVSEFILRAQNAQDLENVTLHFTQEKQQLNERQVEFELAADIAGTAEAKPVKKPEEASQS